MSLESSCHTLTDLYWHQHRGLNCPHCLRNNEQKARTCEKVTSKHFSECVFTHETIKIPQMVVSRTLGYQDHGVNKAESSHIQPRSSWHCESLSVCVCVCVRVCVCVCVCVFLPGYNKRACIAHVLLVVHCVIVTLWVRLYGKRICGWVVWVLLLTTYWFLLMVTSEWECCYLSKYNKAQRWGLM